MGIGRYLHGEERGHGWGTWWGDRGVGYRSEVQRYGVQGCEYRDVGYNGIGRAHLPELSSRRERCPRTGKAVGGSTSGSCFRCKFIQSPEQN